MFGFLASIWSIALIGTASNECIDNNIKFKDCPAHIYEQSEAVYPSEKNVGKFYDPRAGK